MQRVSLRSSQAHRQQEVDTASVIGAEEAETAQQGSTEATEPAWDLMKLLPSTLGDPSSVDNPGEPPLDAAPLDREACRALVPEWLMLHCRAALSLQVLLSMHKPAAHGLFDNVSL